MMDCPTVIPTSTTIRTPDPPNATPEQLVCVALHRALAIARWAALIAEVNESFCENCWGQECPDAMLCLIELIQYFLQEKEGIESAFDAGVAECMESEE